MRKSTFTVVGLALAVAMAGPVRAAGNEEGAPRFRLEILLDRDVENTEPAGEALLGLDERDVAAYDGQTRRMVLRPEVSLRLLAAVQKLPDLPERLYKLRALWLNGDLEDIVSHRGFRMSLDGRLLSGGILLSRFSSLSPDCPVIHAEMDGSRRIELRFAGDEIDSKVEALFAGRGISAEPPAVPVVEKPAKPPVLLAVNPAFRDAEEGWSLYFGYPDDVFEVRYRVADDPGSDWSVAGYGRAELGELGPGRHRIELEAIDFAGELAGRYALWLDPEHEATLGSRHVLDMTANSWFTFSDREDWDETCFYFSHLLGHREALKEVRYSFDNCGLDRRIALSTELDKGFEWVPRTVSYACAQLTYRDGETTAPRRFYHHPEEIARLAKPAETAAEAPADSSPARPVSLSTSVSSSGWMLLFDFEPERSVRTIRYRFAGDLEWHSTGPDTSVNLLTGERLARTWMVIEAHRLTLGRQRIDVKLTDWNGVESGPYSVWFDPEREIVETAKDELRKPESEWAGFDHETEDRALLMFSGVVGSLDALREVRYSIDGCALDRRLPFRPWNYLGEDQGDYDDGFVWLPRTVRSACVQLVFRDGETTEPRQYFHKPER